MWSVAGKEDEKMSALGRTSLPERLSMSRLKSRVKTEDIRPMLSLRAAPGVLALAVLVLVGGTIVCHAAKKSASSGKLYVPANILKGAALTKGRVFRVSNVPEDSLAGIRLGRAAKEILVKWGNPSRITVGTVRTEGPGTGAPPLESGVPWIPSEPSRYDMFSSRPIPDMRNPYGSPMDGLPPLGQPPLSTSTTTTGQSTVLSQEEVTWTYDLDNGITLEFIITDGLITQITAGGLEPWSLSRTRAGLQLGDTYKLVLWVCGYPESQEYSGRFLRARYVTNNRLLFTFLRNRLVGVTIALVPQELQ